jgi:hypothetical protein
LAIRKKHEALVSSGEKWRVFRRLGNADTFWRAGAWSFLSGKPRRFTPDTLLSRILGKPVPRAHCSDFVLGEVMDGESVFCSTCSKSFSQLKTFVVDVCRRIVVALSCKGGNNSSLENKHRLNLEWLKG